MHQKNKLEYIGKKTNALEKQTLIYRQKNKCIKNQTAIYR